MRLTQHHGRAGKDGVYSVKHNDRRFDITHSDHIDESRMSDNVYWHWLYPDYPKLSFDDAEDIYYREQFEAHLDAQNERNDKAGHSERNMTMDEYRNHKNYCPEETIEQIGKKGDKIDRVRFFEVISEQIKWEEKRFPNIKYLDLAVHCDEQGQMHCHKRKVWWGHDKDGHICVGQNKALAEMGIERPDINKPVSRRNNPKQTYTAECREHFFELVREHYPEFIPLLEETPQEASKSGLSLIEYQNEQELQRLNGLQYEVAQEQRNLAQIEADKRKTKEEADREAQRAEKAKKEVSEYKVDVNRYKELKEAITRAEEDLQETMKATAEMAELKKPSLLGKNEGKITISQEHWNKINKEISSVARDKKAIRDKEADLSKREKDIAAKETELSNREEQIAEKEKSVAEDKSLIDDVIQDATGFVCSRAEQLVDDIMANKGVDKTRLERMEKYMQGRVDKDGIDMLTKFNAYEKTLEQEIAKELSQPKQKYKYSRDDDYLSL